MTVHLPLLAASGFLLLSAVGFDDLMRALQWPH